MGLVAGELRRRRWTESDLSGRPKGDPAKVEIAGRLRSETTMTLAWVARRLEMGIKTHLVHLLYGTVERRERRADGLVTTID
jgi:hypothetical protein